MPESNDFKLIKSNQTDKLHIMHQYVVIVNLKKKNENYMQLLTRKLIMSLPEMDL